MAFDVESTTASGASLAVASVTWAHTVTSANKITVDVCLGNGSLADRQVSSVTYNGVSLSQVAAADDGVYNHTEIWTLHNPSIGTYNVVVTLAGLCSEVACGVTGYTDSATALGTPNTNATTGTNPSVTVTDSASGDIVISAVASDSGPLATMTEGGTLRWEIEDIDSDTDANAQRQTATGASTVCSWTCSASEPYAAVGVAVKPAVKASYARFPKRKMANELKGRSR